MAVYYFDTSALVRRYVLEAGSSWVTAVSDPAAGNDIYVARIASVELISAVTRRVRGGGLTPADAAAALGFFRRDFASQYQIIEVSEALLRSATVLVERHALRAYDAVHLAAVLELHSIREALGAPPLILISSDLELNAAGIAEGLTVNDPSTHS